MTFPASVADLEAIVDCMRRRGVLQAFGIVLGPEPVKVAPAELTPEERRQARIEAERQAIRDRLGRDATNSEIDRYIDPAVFEVA